MLQTLFYIPREVMGWPLFGFGLLLTLWLVGCAIVLAVAIRRHGFDAVPTPDLETLLSQPALVDWLKDSYFPR